MRARQGGKLVGLLRAPRRGEDAEVSATQPLSHKLQTDAAIGAADEDAFHLLTFCCPVLVYPPLGISPGPVARRFAVYII